MELHPDEPWRWNAEWKTGILRCKPPTRLAFQWLFSLFLGVVAAYILLHWNELAKDDESTFLFSGAVLMATVVLIPSIYSTFRWWRWRTTTCELQTNPGVIGGDFQAVIRAPLSPGQTGSLTVHLTSYYYSTKSGVDTGQGMRTKLWQDTQEIPVTLSTFDEQGLALIPIHFSIPTTCEPTTPGIHSERVQWDLHVTSAQSGMNLSVVFVVPVFVLPDISPSSETAQPAPLQTVSARSAIIVREGADEFELHYDLGRGALFVIAFTLILLAQYGFFAAFVLRYATSPIGLTMVGVCGLFHIGGLSKLFFGRYHLHVTPAGVAEVKSLFGFQRRTLIPLQEIEHTDIHMNRRAGKRRYYALQIHTGNGIRTVLPNIPDQQEAEALARRIGAYTAQHKNMTTPS